MQYYFAPMEGITGYIYRNAHHDCFGGADKYFTPFITPKQGKCLTSRELNDVLPEHNEGVYVVPQIMTNQAEGFLKVAKILADMGYQEVNLNLGCPSGTVVTKQKGAGFLGEPERLDAFLKEVFHTCAMEISVKTRIGLNSPEEFERLLQIFNRYPLKELIVHPRTREEFYQGQIHMDCFEMALAESKNPLCYNGNLFGKEQIRTFQTRFPQVDRVMLGRGLLIDPALAQRSRTKPDAAQLRAFHDRLTEDYSRVLSGERDVLFKMKELWFYMGRLFADSDKAVKKIRKAQRLGEYQAAVTALFHSCPILELQGDEIEI